MKHSISMRNILTDIALAGTLLLALISAQAMTSLVDYDRSPEGTHQSGSVNTAAPMKNGGFHRPTPLGAKQFVRACGTEQLESTRHVRVS